MTQVNVLWLSVIGSYIIQTKLFEKIVGRERIVEDSSNQAQASQQQLVKPNFTIHLAIIYLLSWYLLIPFSNIIWSHNLSQDKEVRDLSIDEADEDMSTPISLPEPNSTSHKSSVGSKMHYFFKIMAMSFFLALIVVTYTMGLGLSPAFDVSLIQNCAFFEMTTLLYGVCGVSRNKNVFRNFLIMMVAVVSILIISYTNATCNLLADKLSVNKVTGEVNDPWLFDRLKAGLLCGLGSLSMGPFAVGCNRWFESSNHLEKITFNRKNLFYIPLGSILFLIPFLNLNDFSKISEEYLSNGKFWFYLITGILFGTLPNIISVIKLNASYPNEFVTTCNLGAIIMMGLVEWICESGHTVIVRWEVVSYIFLSLCTIALYINFRGNLTN